MPFRGLPRSSWNLSQEHTCAHGPSAVFSLSNLLWEVSRDDSPTTLWAQDGFQVLYNKQISIINCFVEGLGQRVLLTF